MHCEGIFWVHLPLIGILDMHWIVMSSDTVMSATEKNILDLKTFYETAMINRPYFTEEQQGNSDEVMAMIAAALLFCQEGYLRLTRSALGRAHEFFQNNMLKVYDTPYNGQEWKRHYWNAVKLGMTAKMILHLNDLDALLDTQPSTGPSLHDAKAVEMDGLLAALLL